MTVCPLLSSREEQRELPQPSVLDFLYGSSQPPSTYEFVTLIPINEQHCSVPFTDLSFTVDVNYHNEARERVERVPKNFSQFA